MYTEVITKAKEQLAKWRKDLLENENSVEKYQVKDNEELYRELESFPRLKNDYLWRLAEVNLEREFSSFNQDGTMEGMVYRFTENYLIIYSDNGFVKWETRRKLEECYEFFIELKEMPN